MENAQQEKRKQILSGNLWKIIFYILFPLFLYKFTTSFFQVVDSLMVSNISDESVSSVSQVNQIKNFISCFGSGIAGGTAIIVSRLFGEGNIESAKKHANVGFFIELILGALTLVIILPFANFILKGFNVSDEILDMSSSYFRVATIEIILTYINTYFIAVKRSSGRTKSILYLNLLVMAIKLGLNALFVYVLKVDSIIYIALASVIANGVMTVIGLIMLFKKDFIFRINPREWMPTGKILKDIIIISIPLILSQGVIDLGKVIFNSICASYGLLAVGALGVSNHLTGVASNPFSAVQDGEASIISANVGNKNLKRCLKTLGICLIFAVGWATISFLCIRVFFEDQIISLFNHENTSVEFVNDIKEILMFDCITIPTLIICDTCLGFLLGFGKTFMATVINIVRIASRIASILIMKYCFPELGIMSIGIAMGISNASIMLVSVVSLTIALITIKRKGYKGMRFSDPEPEYIEVAQQKKSKRKDSAKCEVLLLV